MSPPPFAGPGSVRSFSGNAFLTGEPSVGIPAIVDSNGNGLNGRKLKVLSGANVIKVLFSKSKTAKGVEYFFSNNPDEVLVVNAKKKIILCGGGIASPAILQRSGYGDAALLTSLDIPVVYDNPNVGAHLANHVLSQAIVNMQTIPLPAYSQGYVDLPAITGTTDQRIMQIWNLPSLAFFPPAIVHTLGIPSDGVDVAYLNILPQSEGHVQIVSKDPMVDPNVFFNVYSDGGPSDLGSDANKMVEFLKQLKTAFPALYPGPGSILYPTPQNYADGDDALFQTVLDTFGLTQHPSCTCRMATSAADGVVDGDLHVFGVRNLMVADNSAAAVINDGNTQTQAFYIGAMAAQILRGS